MSPSYLEIATLVTALAGLLTALVSFLNVRELKLARTVSSVPVLVLKSKSFVADCSRNDEADFGPGDEEPALEVFNFGNGPALNVRCSWKIDAEQIVSLLNTYDPHHQRSIGFEPSPFVDEETMKLYWNHFYKRQIESLHNPIAPSSGAVTTTISLPAFYLESFHIYIRLAVHARPEKRRAFELKEFPKAVLSLSHHDLAGLGHTDIYDVRLHYSHNGTHRFENKNSYACELMAMKTS